MLGLLAGFGPLAASNGGGSNLLVPRVIAGYLLGLLAGEVFRPRRPRPAVRQASLRVRNAADLLPGFARWLPWLTLLPVVASPLLLIGWHPRGRSRVVLPNHSGSCAATATWPRPAYLFAVMALAVVALSAIELTLYRLRTRQQPAEDAEFRRLDHVMRGYSARAAVAASAALGLMLVQQVVEAVDAGAHSGICTANFPYDSLTYGGNVYSWTATAEPWLSAADSALLVLALATFFACRRLRVHTLPDEPGSR